MFHSTRFFGVLVAAAVVSASLGATVQAASAEDDLIHKGVEARRKQDDLTALDLFKKAYEINHSPRAAAQIGLAEIALGRWFDAETHLEEALAGSSDAWIQKNTGTLKESLSRVRQEVGRLEILGTPEGAEIVIGGQVKGTLPLAKPVRVRTGEVRFEVRAPGHESLVRTVRVTPGQLTRETVELVPVAAPVATTTAPPPVSTEPQAPPPVVTTTPASPTEPATSSNGRTLRITGLALGGAGAVAAGVGLVFGLKARSAAESDANRTMFDRDADSTGHRYETLQWIGYGVGAALLVGGVTTYLIGNAKHGEGGTSVSLLPTDGGAFATIGGRL